jgi:hypothetical protein
MSDLNIGASMVALRIHEEDAARDAAALAIRKAKRARLLEEAAKKPHAPIFVASWFRGRRTIVEM